MDMTDIAIQVLAGIAPPPPRRRVLAEIGGHRQESEFTNDKASVSTSLRSCARTTRGLRIGCARRTVYPTSTAMSRRESSVGWCRQI